MIIDHNLEITGLSYRDEIGLPIIRINLTKISECENVIAHVLSHEYGLHVYGHINSDPSKKTHKEMEFIEDQADSYASYFIKYHNYDVDKIADYIRMTTNSNKVLNSRLKF